VRAAAVRALARVVVTAIPALHRLNINRPAAMSFMASRLLESPVKELGAKRFLAG
jgi:hypothetical protein